MSNAYGDTHSRELVPGVLRGYRAWRLRGRSKPTGLHSRFNSFSWEPEYSPDLLPVTCYPDVSWRRGLNTAGCRVRDSVGRVATRLGMDPDRFLSTCATTGGRLTGAFIDAHGSSWHAPTDSSPAAKCSCGFYSYYDRFSEEFLGTRAGVHGSVRAYGKVLLGPRGFRAEKVEVEAICMSHNLNELVPDANNRARLVGNVAAYYNVPWFWSQEELLRAFPPNDLTALLPPEPAVPEVARATRTGYVTRLDKWGKPIGLETPFPVTNFVIEEAKE